MEAPTGRREAPPDDARCETGWGDGLSPAAVSDWLDFRVSRPIQLHINPFEYSREITSDLGIPEADDTITLALKPKLPFTITFRSFVLVVVPAVEFNDEMCGGTEEVDNIGTDRSLPSKMGALRRQLFKGTP